MRTKWVAFVVVVLLFCAAVAVQAGQRGRGAGAACDRACLQGFVDRYLDAWIARDPKQLPLAPNVKYTENGQRLGLGDGSWNVSVGKGKYRLWVPDTQTGQVALITTVTEEGASPQQTVASMLALRLKVVNQQISEVEALFVRPATGGAGGGGGARGAAPAAGAPAGAAGGARGTAAPAVPPANRLEALGTPNPLFMQPIPVAERMSRENLISVSNMYFTGMQKNDGLGDYPFTDDCDRFENAGKTTNVPTPPGETRPDPKTANMYSSQWGCMEQFQSGLIHFVSRIRDRRFVAVDPEYGLAFSFTFFDHMGGKSRTYTHPDGRVITAGPTAPFTWEIAELFRVEKGKIHRIEAILVQSPYGQQSGWSTYEESMSDKGRDIR
jgi:hypothetical protein